MAECPTSTPKGVYNIAPAFPISDGQILSGYAPIADVIVAAARQGAELIAIDGYGGNLWAELQAGVAQALQQEGVSARWVDTADAFLSESDLLRLIAPSLGGDDPLFGKLFEGDLSSFFDLAQLQTAALSTAGQLTIVYGSGAALAGPADVLLYVDVPKDVIQQRARAKQVTNLGVRDPGEYGATYKRLFFVDWPALNRHKAVWLPAIDWFVDATDLSAPRLIAGDNLRVALSAMATSYFRVRPWFYPGAWGGQYMKEHFPGLPQDVPNYAWSFELIVPENGLVLESSGQRLECSFDLLMFQHYREVLGTAAERFGYNFPIRFDYLDTMDGGNLSVQCHPRPEYARTHFGEPFTQDESYYIVKAEAGARVYLGLRDGVQPDQFRAEVERSQREQVQIEIDRFVGSVPARPHDLFLIPSGTVHGAGQGNLVLEISATPYIYTFKIYDWMRLDLNGKPRQINIARAWENIQFDRQETYVREQLCPQPRLLQSGPGWQEFFVGTHPELFYAVHRYELESPVGVQTEGRCHVLNVVEGTAVVLETGQGQVRFNCGETFVVPAATGQYRLLPMEGPCKVVVAFVK